MDRVLFVDPMSYGANPGVDAIAHGVVAELRAAGLEPAVAIADFAWPDHAEIEARAVDRAVAAGFAGVILYILDPVRPADVVARARAAGTKVVTFERPRFAVDASLVYPNFNQGAYLGEELARVLDPGARVAVVGGPKIIDDDELVAGIVAGVVRSGLTLVNDPTIDRHRNESDVRAGGREAALRILDDHPDIAGLVPFNDETMLGTLDALDERGLLGRIRTVSRNGTPLAVEAVRAGRTVGTWDIDAPSIGRRVAALMARCLDGELGAGALEIGPIGRFIDRDRLDSWLPYERRVAYDPLPLVTFD